MGRPKIVTVCKISLAQNADFYNITSIGFVPSVSSAAGSTDAGENLALIETRLTPVMIKLCARIAQHVAVNYF